MADEITLRSERRPVGLTVLQAARKYYGMSDAV